MRNARILILDDDERWLQDFHTILDGKVASITTAQTLEEAIDLLDRHYFNVAIVDQCLDDADLTDERGMLFLQAIEDRGLHGVVIPIFCTAYGHVRNLNKAWRDHEIADFINKNDFEDDHLMTVVQKALNRLHCPNPIELDLETRGPLDSLWTEKEWAQREVAAELTAELHDLLCRLFPTATRLWIRPIPAGQSGAVMIEVEPTYAANTGVVDIVKFGKREKIRREIDNYDKFVDLYVGNQISTKVEGVTGRVMGAIRYRLVGASETRAESLGERYLSYGPADTRQVLDTLFNTTCRRWYDNREGPRRRRDLVALYVESQHIDWELVWAAVASTTIAASVAVTGDKLAFPGVSGSFLHPRYWLEAHQYTYSVPTWLAMTHGDLNEHNVLVTEGYHCWLIDFYRTGKGHILRDIVELETGFKFSLTRLSSYTERAEFEAALLAPSSLGTHIVLPVSTARYANAVAVIEHLRGVAEKVLGLQPDLREYQVALLLQTLKYLSLDFLKRDLLTRSHALLSAAMICTKLEALRAGAPNVTPAVP